MPTEMELTLEQTQQGVSYEVSVILGVLRIILVILPEYPSDTKVMDQRDEVLKSNMFQDFRYSDTARLSRSVEVLKLKNFKKDETLKLSKLSNQEWYEHVGPEVESSQDGKVSRWRKDYAWLMISRCSRSQCQIQFKEQALSRNQ
ncbi:hypothetical protein Tco_0583805 [Tanacetum coccineum]